MNLNRVWLALVVMTLLGAVAGAQDPQDPQSRPQGASTSYERSNPNYSSPRRPSDSSELEKENLARVAASTSQIMTVLARDPGLVVELKRLIAKEASDNGQVVQDADLTEQAIQDRLNHDIQFRGVATRLLQRYGYLMPAVNPDSAMGKEQELILKERARRLVQIESEEDAQTTPRYSGNQSQLQNANDCSTSQDPAVLQRCAQNRQLRNRSGVPPSTSPQTPSPQDQPDMLQQPRGSQLIQTTNNMTDSGGLSPNLQNRPGSGQDTFSTTPGTDGGLNENDLPSRNSSTLRGGNLQDYASNFGFGGVNPSTSTGLSNQPMYPRRNRPFYEYDREVETTAEFAPLTMVHKANPFSDVPSLYEMYMQQAPQRKLQRFGLDVFRNDDSSLAEAVPMDLPVGPDYVVGPGDSLSVDIWGGVSQRLIRVVDREGRITLPEAGPLLVSGKTLADVQLAVQKSLRTEFRDVSADVSLAKLRTVRVYVVGDVLEPGAYDISSLSTPLNAIFAAGGVTERGSLRKLKHYRGKKLVQEVDAYDLLLNGVQNSLQNLENGDSLLVPSVGPQVTIDGMVRRPSIYELNGEKNLAEALDLAGGILPAGTLSHIEVQKLDPHEKRTMVSFDVAPTDSVDSIMAKLRTFPIEDADQIHVFPIAPGNMDAIYLQGHVIRPGKYTYVKGMKVTDIVGSYKDILPEPAGNYAEIIRINQPDNHPSVESFNLADALEHPENAPVLQPLDTVRVFGRYDFQSAPAIWVGGEVRQPGKYNTSGQVHLRDAIYLAGGLAPDAGLANAQVFRTQSDGTMKILSIDLKEAIDGNPVDNVLLLPRDRLLIHKSAAKVDPATVYITGEVAKPGRYPLTTNMHVQDLVRVAGGLKRAAYTETADLTRFPENQTGVIAGEHFTVNLAGALAGESEANLAVRDGDVLAIQPIPNWNDIAASITVRGEVQHPGTYGIKPGEHLSSILERSGGLTPQGSSYGAVLMRRDVREIQMKEHQELIVRLKAEETQLRALPEGDQDQKSAKINALARTETTLQQLQANDPIGRVVVHIPSDINQLKGSPSDVAVREGDILLIPKKMDYVMVNGQVFNPTAVSYLPGRSAKWYLSQAGGLTPAADKKAVFVIRADGSVISAQNNSSSWFMGDPLSASLRPGDSVVVPEKAPKVGGINLTNALQIAQLAASIGVAIAYIHP